MDLDENNYKDENTTKKVPKSFLLRSVIIIFVLILLVIGITYFSINKNLDFFKNKNNTNEDIQKNINLDNNKEETNEINNTQNKDTQENNDTNSQENINFNFSDKTFVSEDENTNNIITISNFNKNNSYDLNMTSIQKVSSDQELKNVIGISTFSAILNPIYLNGFNRKFSSVTYNALKENNIDLKQNYVLFSEDINLDLLNENTTKKEFFEVNRDLVFSFLKEDENFEDIKNTILEIHDSNGVFKRITLINKVELNENLYNANKFKYIEDENKFYNKICDLNNNCVNLYDQNKEWTTIKEWKEIYTMQN